MKNWYQIKAKSKSVVDISIHDEIGFFGVSAGDFIKEIRSNMDAKVINLSIHSPGGSALDGIAIFNALKGHPASVNAHVDGIAASAASFILMAGDHISMPEDSFIMIHNAFGMALGDSDDMRDMADVLDKIGSTMINIYHNRTNVPRETLAEMLSAETWLGAEEALELGFTDTIADAVGVAAKISGYEDRFKKLPITGDSDILKINGINTVNEYGKYLRDAGSFSRKAADALVARARIVVTGDPLSTDTETGKEILAALDKVKVPTGLT